MKLLAPARRFDPNAPELIDRPDTGQRLLLEELHGLEKLNRHFAAHRLVLDYVRRFAAWSGVKSLNLRVLAIWTMELFARSLIRSDIVSHDARQSCRAAFTPSELGGMAQQASLNHFKIKRHHVVFRMVLEGRKG